MAWFEIRPGYATVFHQRGWKTFGAFFAWAGFIVNRHRHRQVEQVCFNGGVRKSVAETYYLKKEFAVSLRERFRNAWLGFGWCSTSVREAKVLLALREAGIGCPEVAAFGESGTEAFVLLRDEAGMRELRSVLQGMHSEVEGRALAVALGRELARLHGAGFHHADLFAKHILAVQKGSAFQFCMLDWQRGRRRAKVSWRMRCRDLAVLDATLHPALASDRLRLRCLHAYVAALADGARMPAGRLARQVRGSAARLKRKRNMREIGQLPIPAHEQQFVSLSDGQVLLVRSCADDLGSDFAGQLVGRGPGFGDAINTLRVTLPARPTASLWELPALAHVLFRLHRFGIPAVRLLGARQDGEEVVLFLAPTATMMLAEALNVSSRWVRARLLEQAGWIVRQIHEAGYRLSPDACWLDQLGVRRDSGELMLIECRHLRECAMPWQELAQEEIPVQVFDGSRADRLRFLRGYLQSRSWDDRQRQWIHSLQHPDLQPRERQVSV